MKTNIIHVLILAIILIVGWSLFTVLQDIYNPDSLKNGDYGMTERGKQYLPLTQETYSRQQKYPEYKIPQHVQTQIAQSQSTNTTPSYKVVENSYSLNSTTNNGLESKVSKLGSSNTTVAIERAKHSSAAADRTKITTYNGNIGGALADDNSVVRALRSALDANAVEQHPKKGDKAPYNSVPVGDGLYLLMLMGALYTLFKSIKNKLTESSNDNILHVIKPLDIFNVLINECTKGFFDKFIVSYSAVGEIFLVCHKDKMSTIYAFLKC